MTEEIPFPNPPLSPEEQAAVARLTGADLQVIDEAIFASCSVRWYKVARVVTTIEKAIGDRYPDLSYVFYAQRLSRLADEGRLDSQGDLSYMRFSEVRLPSPGSGNES